MHFSKVFALALATATTVVADNLERYRGTMKDAGLSAAAVTKFNSIADRYGRSDNVFVTTTEFLTKYATDWDFPFGEPDDYVIYDLRSVQEYKAQHIDDAINYPVTTDNMSSVCRSIAMASPKTLPRAFRKAHHKKYVIFHYESNNQRGEAVAAAYLEYILRNGKSGLLNSLERQNVVLLMGSFKEVVQVSQRLKKEGRDYLEFNPSLRSAKRAVQW